MKIYDLVELIENDEELLSNGIQKGCHGVVINVENNKCEVIFLNSKNQGDYACADIDLKSLKIKGKLPKELQGELDVFIKNLDKNKHISFDTPQIKEYDMVELIVEDEKYSKHGVHKGMCGCVMQDYAVQNYIEVDFSGIDENGNFYGDCISVKIDDLKVVE